MPYIDSANLEHEIAKSREELVALQSRIKSLVNRRADAPKTGKKDTVKIETKSLAPDAKAILSRVPLTK
jgi:hypothetical protein